MARRSRSKLPLIVIMALVIAVATFFLLPDLPDELQFYSVGDFFELTLSPNSLIKCTIEDKMQIQYSDGTKVDAQTVADTFNPLIKFDVVHRNTREQIASFPSDIYLTCTVPTNAQTKVSGSFYVIATASDPSGNEIKVYEKNIPFSERIIKNNVKIKLPSYLIHKNEIDSKMPTGSGDYTSWIRIHTAPFMTFNIVEANSKSTYTGKDLLTSYLVRIVKPISISQQTAAQGTQVKIISFDPKIFQLPLTNTQKFITVRGQADNWKSTEGMPWIKIVNPSGVTIRELSFAKATNTDNDKWTEFIVSTQLPDSLQVGTWKIIMGSNQPLRSTLSTVTFEVLKDGIVPKPPRSSEPPVCDVKGTDNSCLSLKSFVAYNINLDGGAVSGTVPNVQLFDVKVLYKATLTGDLKGTSKKVAEIQLRPQLDLSKVTDQPIITNTQFKANYDLSVNGNSVITDRQFSGRQLDPRTVYAPASKTYQMMYISMNVAEITDDLKKAGIVLQNGDSVILNVDFSGSADATVGLDKFSIVVDGMNYQYEMINNNDYFAPEDCQGLSGKEALECKGNQPPTGSGDACDPLTSQECANLNNKDEPQDPYSALVDLITSLTKGENKQTSGNPSGDAGTSGACKNLTAEECFNELIKSKLPSVPTIDPNIWIVLGISIFLVIILLIAPAIRRRK